MREPAELKLDRVSKRYDAVTAVDDVSFDVPPGAYVVLLGPSGSGKTTVLSMLGGFTLPSAGRILIGDEDVTLVPPAKRPTATVFQDYALFPHLGVARNVAFGLSVRGVPKAEIAQRVAAALKLVGLEDFGGRSISAMSGGQRQRIALARALVTEPALLLLDEPLGALDLSLRRQMQEELRHIQRSQGRTFVHVTHDQEEAMAIADLIVIMNRGRIEDIGPPTRVYERPRTCFTANFLGESTVIEGTVVACTDGRIVVDSVCGRVEVSGDRAVGSLVHIALRPEALRIGRCADGDQPLGEMQVEDCIFQGSFQRVAGSNIHGLRLLAKVEPQSRTVGQCVPISARRSGLVLLED
ncbi:MAG: ABC transporter ATP-binding protein [Burkholderiales bacterium]|nr:ABC transporter ATP-binding protein [Burkholderiales bacterium]